MFLRRFSVAMLIIFCFLALFLFSLPASARALAASNDAITVTSQSHSVQFPASITFTVSASDPASTFVSAAIVVNLQSNLGPETHTMPVTGMQHALRLTWKERTSGNNFIPPGSVVYYYWRFSDKAGNNYNQPQEQLTTVDTRFTWQHLSQGLLQVNWYNRSQAFGNEVLKDAVTNVQRISATLGGGLRSAINLWVYGSDDDFHGSLPPNSYEWVGGIAFPTLHEASIVVTDGNDLTLIRDMPHELTHLIFHQLIANGEDGGEYAPTWFDEGLAVYNQQYHEADMISIFKQALARHELLPLSDISFGFPADANKAYLAYAQSWNLLGYMFSTFGQVKMLYLIKDMNNPQYDFDEDLTQALGLDEVHLENKWLQSLGQPLIPVTDQPTPTPQPTPRTKVQISGSGDDRSWGLIALGAILVIVSLSGFVLLLVRLNRQGKAAAPVTDPRANQPVNQDPGIYMHDSMYARIGVEQPPGISSQGYGEAREARPQHLYPTPPSRQYPQE